MQTTVTRLREKRSSIAVGFSTKDRVELTRQTVGRLLDEDRIDLFWFDGSATPEGRDLPGQLMPGHAASTAMYHGVVGGPDSAILYGLMTLRDEGYEWIVLVENDVLLDEGWLDALFGAVEAAGRDGFRVGGASCRVIPERVLSFNGTYTLLFNAGAGFIALTREGVDLVIRNYRTLDGVELVSRLLDLTGIDVRAWWSAMATPSHNILLCADWMFDLTLYMNGLVMAAPPVTVARNIDPGSAVEFVGEIGDHPEGARGALTRREAIRETEAPTVRFQPLRPSSGRVLVGVHHLRLGRPGDQGTGPVRLSGTWTRRWLQFFGPFELFGSGSVEVTLFDAPLTLLLHARAGRAVVEIAGDGMTRRVEIDPPANPLPIVELSLDAFGQARGTMTVSVLSGEVGLIGLGMAPELTPYFANATPNFDFLAW